jgi:hypothetical protein
MKLNIGSTNNTWRNAGLIALAAGILAYPAYRLVKYALQKRRDMANAGLEDGTLTKKLFNAYRGTHKPHHRKAEANGHLQDGVSHA